MLRTEIYRQALSPTINFAVDMKIDSKFFEQRWVRAIQAEFGAQGVLAVIRLLTSVFDSPQGYWRAWSSMDQAVLAGETGMTVDDVKRLIDRLVEYDIINGDKLRRHHTVTSRTIQLEYIRQAGVARARKLDWKTHPLISLEELLELGIAPAIVEDFDEEYGVPLPVSRRAPELYPGFRQVRLRHRDPCVHIYRVVRLKKT
ncbi:MAG: DUF4373 domain-containing protein [Muribaculaceae bacterium]|nr:DUF4373 domain-containing protein [Muribaculaceae bacterium]